jgi:hypothetical protein
LYANPTPPPPPPIEGKMAKSNLSEFLPFQALQSSYR